MVFGGKVYETNGSQAVAVHEAEAIRPLPPILRAPSLRLFRSDLQPIEGADPLYFYANPTALAAAGAVLSPPSNLDLGFEAYVGAVLVSDAHRLEPEEADEIVLGLTLLTLVVSPGLEMVERRAGAGFGASHDLGGVVGPVLTTPDELDENVLTEEQGRRYGLTAVTRVNGVERGRGDLADLPLTFGQAISAAGQTGPLREGDLVALGPIASPEAPIRLEPGDEVQVAVEKLGALTLRVSME